MPEFVFPRPTRGIDNLSDDTALPAGALRVASNVDLSRDGVIRSRPGARTILPAAGLHSLWADGQSAFVVHKRTLCRLTLAPAATLTPLATLADDAPLAYARTPRGIAFVARAQSGLIDGDTVRALAPENAGVPRLAAGDNGGLAAGDYQVAAAYLIGDEESALSASAAITLREPGGIVLTEIPQPHDPDVDAIRIYRSTVNGGELYRAADVPVGMARYILGDGGLGRVCDNRYLARIEHGSGVCLWNGRLLVVQGQTLRISQALRYGLYSPRHGFVARAAPITMVAPTDGAVFVATATDTVAITGRRPGEWVVNRVDCGTAVAGSGVAVALSAFSAEWAGTSAVGAIWLTTTGYVVGLPDATVVSPQAAGLRIPAMAHGQSLVINRRILTTGQSR